MNKISRRVILGYLGSVIATPAILRGESLKLGQFFTWRSTTVVQENQSSVDPHGWFEVPGRVNTYIIRAWRSDISVVERTRSITNILGAEVTDFVNEQLIEAAIEARGGDLLPLIG